MELSNVNTLSFSLRLRERLIINLVRVTQPLYERWFRKRRPVWQQSVASLLAYEQESLGKALGRFLQHNKLTLIPRFENHDVCHVLLGYKTSVMGESEMQFCLLGNGKRSLYVLGTCAVAGLVFPEYWSRFRSAFTRGQSLRPFHYWYFEYLLAEPLEELQAFIRNDEINFKLNF